MPYTVHGWRPASVVVQPAITAIKPSGIAQVAARKPARARLDPAARELHDAPQHEREHQQRDADHDVKGEEHDGHGRPVLARKVLQSAHEAVRIVRQIKAAEHRNRDLEAIAFFFLIRNRKEIGRDARARFPQAFHRRELGGLMLQRVEAVRVADHHLDRHHDDQKDQRHLHHHAAFLERASLAQIHRADAENDEARRHEKRAHRMSEPVRKRRSEDHVEEAHHFEAAVGQHAMALRRLHPAIDGEYPERRDHRAGGDENRGHHVRPLRHELAPEQQHAEKRRFEEERRQHFVAHQRADDVRGRVRKAAPVGAELKRHHDARHHAHAERHREDLQPERREPPVDVAFRDPPVEFERRDVARQADRERRQQNMKRDDPRELEAGEQDGIDIHERSFVQAFAAAMSRTRAARTRFT